MLSLQTLFRTVTATFFVCFCFIFLLLDILATFFPAARILVLLVFVCDNPFKKLPAKLTLTEDSRILTTAAAPSPTPSPSPSSGPPSARSTRASKWGRLLGSSSVDSASDTSAKVAVSRSLSARESLRESTAQARQSSTSSSNGGQGNKVITKA